MYCITVQFEIHAEHVDAFREQMLLQARNSLEHEESCRQFDVCFAQGDPTKCFLYERYDDQAAFDAHLASDHFMHFDATVKDWLKSKTVQTWTQEDDY